MNLGRQYRSAIIGARTTYSEIILGKADCPIKRRKEIITIIILGFSLDQLCQYRLALVTLSCNLFLVRRLPLDLLTLPQLNIRQARTKVPNLNTLASTN